MRLLLLVLLGACASPPPPAVQRHGDEIVVAGTLVRIGTPVVLWTDAGGYDAYSLAPRFPEEVPKAVRGRRRHDQREGVPADADLATVQGKVDQFVLHYDVCGTSRQCFKVLHDVRCLSVHFLLDVDGTIYQTLDVRERAWHATVANHRSVGIEIAHIGAYPAADDQTLRGWYGGDAQGPFVTFPKWMTVPGVRTPDFVARPARAGLCTGEIHGSRYHQYDFTHEQYLALAHLAAGLRRALPNLALTAPRQDDGRVRADVLAAEELAAYRGLLGHWHVQRNKVDPGPAFDWERLLRETALLERCPQ